MKANPVFSSIPVIVTTQSEGEEEELMALSCGTMIKEISNKNNTGSAYDYKQSQQPRLDGFLQHNQRWQT